MWKLFPLVWVIQVSLVRSIAAIPDLSDILVVGLINWYGETTKNEREWMKNELNLIEFVSISQAGRHSKYI